MNQLAIKELLYKIADDQLILGHRNSEWTGVGPTLEEDIAFSSMAQDKVGQSLAFYKLLHNMGENDPDTVAFMRNAEQFHNCQLVELPSGEYDFSLIRHFLFDFAESARFRRLSESSVKDIADVANKLKGEIKYHTMHANIWIKKLGNATDESIERLQSALNYAFPYALGIFEKSPFETDLIENGVFVGEAQLQEEWLEEVQNVINQTQLILPTVTDEEIKYGGRIGKHTNHLQPLLTEMSEVFKIDPTAEW
ncbi:MAG: phenylacetate-CoA oxygenase subunit PaaC [Cyclobacteriaceae bacterium]|nr:phenylacetate-CoA oxygenase subunit PaaC [Cyclobacteriaceae bacterium]MCH8514833.1 phenylacetate-CoA oxygenase subunit PaaC [Cyclobacteriaceae bacterium]